MEAGRLDQVLSGIDLGVAFSRVDEATGEESGMSNRRVVGTELHVKKERD